MSFDYEKWRREIIEGVGLDYDSLTEGQKYVILKPIEAPEDYYHDGEVTEQEARMLWVKQMKEEGLTAKQIGKAIIANS